MEHINPNAILGKKTVKELTSLSDSTIYRLEKSGKFPKRQNVSYNRVGWLASEVFEWTKNRITGSRL
ncbi:helix-turn-helix transcriptional regulator [Mannheimia pernigra]|uniref:helix-turn-helix transcriptional regulator n=1 Tax=Mannheimia pernigra TaxID=111844 RepID=UPI0013198259|nr:AlpA family phage regulatory protein [Mannheimia pernigra]QHB17686.1 AlpA family phage regulatory protein [Mannheimia pernigra]